MKFIIRSVSAVTVSLAISFSGAAKAQSETQNYWYLKPLFSLGELSDTSGNTTQLAGQDGKADIEISGGFSAGAVVGFQYNRQWASEIGWEYRSNDSETTLADGTRFTAGNYASNVFFANGIYSFDSNSSWQPYVGLGLAWLQEVDIDLAGNGPELSFSGSADIGLQAFLGSNYVLNSRWSLSGEIRALQFGDIDLEGEGNLGTMRGVGYDPISLQIGLKYRF